MFIIGTYDLVAVDQANAVRTDRQQDVFIPVLEKAARWQVEAGRKIRRAVKGELPHKLQVEQLADHLRLVPELFVLLEDPVLPVRWPHCPPGDLRQKGRDKVALGHVAPQSVLRAVKSFFFSIT